MEKLIEELKAWLRDRDAELRVHPGYVTDPALSVDGIFEIIAKYERAHTPEREATRKIIKTYPCTDCPCTTPCNEMNWTNCAKLKEWQSGHPAPTESLAELANRKGFCYITENTDPNTREVMIIISYYKAQNPKIEWVFFEKSRAKAELRARQYLSALDDKEGGK